MTEYRATVRVELVDDKPTFAEVVIESIDRAMRHATWPVDRSQLAALGSAAARSEETLAAHAVDLGEEMLRSAGMRPRGNWAVGHEPVFAEGGRRCEAIEFGTSVSDGL